MSKLKVGIMGAGSIGCYLGGCIAKSGAADVTLIARQRVIDTVAAHGFHVQAFGDEASRVPDANVRFTSDVEALADVDVTFCCVKSAHTDGAAGEMAGVLPENSLVVSMQNGLRNAATLRQRLGDRPVLAGIVDFNVVSRGDGLYQRTMSGPLTVEASNHPGWQRCRQALQHSNFHVEDSPDIRAEQWTKLLINLNNAVSALSGAPTQAIIRDAGYRRVVAAIMEEGVAVARAARVRPKALRGVPVRWMPRILRLPTPIVRVVARAQMKVDPEARSSMWEDLTKGKLTEVDFLNGEIVLQAQQAGVEAPVNQRVCDLVHKAEEAAKGSPEIPGDDLLRLLTA